MSQQVRSRATGSTHNWFRSAAITRHPAAYNVEVPAAHERRQAERLRYALRVRVNVTREGILVDLSEGGALLRLSRPQDPDKQITLTIEDAEPVHLAARVVRCTQASLETESATLARKEYHVAVQFIDMGRDVAAAVRRIVDNNPPV